MYGMEPKYKRSLHRRAYTKQQKGHHEVCGIVVLNGEKIELEYCKNAHGEPLGFSITSDELERAKRRCWRQGKKFGGVFHSHPVSDAMPGQNDIRGALPNKIMMIYDVCGREAALWKVKIKNGERVLEHIQNFNTGFHK